ncbi:MAG: L,D-transpeptidase family protein [Clostridia bacterium]|nr:L,D-transpeptidase family protein [Clostridia bacterium]
MIDLVRIVKSKRTLEAIENGRKAFSFRIGLGRCPEGPKEREGDGRTPEGIYHVCLKNPAGRFGPSLGLDYPSPSDALKGGADERLLGLIKEAHRLGTRPPWGSYLGGEICIHGGGAGSDWTAGCVALDDDAIALLFPAVPLHCTVEILP